MSKQSKIIGWALRIIVAGIFAMGVIPKLTGGAALLAEKLPGGDTAVLAIALAEALAIVLILVPKTVLVGSVLAALIMLGAIASHVVGPVGFEGDFAAMFVMALIALAASVGTIAIHMPSRQAGMGQAAAA